MSRDLVTGDTFGDTTFLSQFQFRIFAVFGGVILYVCAGIYCIFVGALKLYFSGRQ